MKHDVDIPATDSSGPASPEADAPASARYSSWLTRIVHNISRPPELPVPPRPRVGERIANDRFEILAEIGAGAMGLVLRGLDRKLKRAIAIKLLFPGNSEGLGRHDEELLKQEAQAVARLNHDNIVQVFDLDIWNGLPFLTMELLEGRTLAAMARDRRPSDDLALEIASGVTRGLLHAHERKIVHRDVKPSNIFITSDGRVKLLDFGLAHFLGAGTLDKVESAPVVPAGGTPLYMAPEQWRFQEQDDRVDIWAVGVILFELLAGFHPFRARDLNVTRELVLSPAPPPALQRPDLPRATVDLLQRAMSKDPSRRTGTARELLAELDSLRSELEAERRSIPGVRAEPERRQVTMLCCHLHGSSSPPGASDRAGDVEEVHAVQQSFREVCVGALRQSGARVVTYASDHLLACLGYPGAHEDDAQQAARIALRIVESARARGLVLQIGIHAGVAVVEQHADSRWAVPLAVHGDVPVLTRRLAELAPPRSVVASETACRLFRGLFVVKRASGAGGGGGAAGPAAFHVLRESPVCSRFEAGMARGPTPFVGREQEVRALRKLWADAKGGHGQVLLMSGGAGAGKSRLAQVMKDWASGEGNVHLTGQCWRHLSSDAFSPVIALLQHSMNISRRDPPARRLARLEDGLRRLDMPLSEHLPLLAALLSVPVDPGDEAPASRGTPGVPRIEDTAPTLVEMFHRMAARKPSIWLFEDAQWMDPWTRDLVSRLVDEAPSMRAVIVLTFRPEVTMPWRVGGHVSWMTLGGLPPERAATMMSSLADGALPGALMERLLALADGIPLFIEELARMDPQALFQHPDQARPDLGQAELRTIPPGVHELLLARLDLLGPAEKELARIAATIGRQFSHTLLARCAHAEEQALLSGVHQLVRHGVLDREGSPPAETYRFRHVLLQEAIRLSLLKHQRQQYRAEVVRALQELQPSRTDVLLPT